ncbi:MAG: alanine--tRNA ligase, partial [Chthoniobacterales bacterium]
VSIMQGTKKFTDFTGTISNYETDVFRPIFDEIEQLSGKKYTSSLPKPGAAAKSEQEKIDIAFRVIADHLRTLSFAIADGIQPSNEGRGYVLRRILRRAVRYGRSLGFHEPFFHQLVDVLVRTMSEVFPELRDRQAQVQETIKREEESFNRTLDKGIALFESVVSESSGQIPADFAFRLYDEQGFPLDLTELMARERGLTVDTEGFEQLMEEQRARGRSAQKKEVVALSEIGTNEPTNFLGYEHDHTGADVLGVLSVKGKTVAILNNSVCYAEMGGQVGDTGELVAGGKSWRVQNTLKSGPTVLHFLEGDDSPEVGDHVTLRLDEKRRGAIQRHHTVTHLLHWALHEIVSHDATQKGSYVGPEKLTFDFTSAALTKEQVRAVEKLVNEKIVENGPVAWTEIPFAEAKARTDIMQFFGDKYGEVVRVVQIGGAPNQLNGYSMELCGGTHVRATGDIASFRILSEGAIAAGIRRIEAVSGTALDAWAKNESARQEEKFAALAKKKPGLPQLPAFSPNEITTIDQRAKQLDELDAEVREWEKENAKSAGADLQKRAAAVARDLLESHQGADLIVAEIAGADGNLLQTIADVLKAEFSGPLFLAGSNGGKVDLVAVVPKALTNKFQAGVIIQQVAPIVGGKGGGRPEQARGAGKDDSKLQEALARARAILEAGSVSSAADRTIA